MDANEIDDSVVEWMPKNRYDPQGRIRALAAKRGHRLGPWAYVGHESTGGGMWRFEGCHCLDCTAEAAYGSRARPGRHERKLAIWGRALKMQCPGVLRENAAGELILVARKTNGDAAGPATTIDAPA